jgi:transposase
VRQASRNVSFDRLLADAGYDAEHNHTLCRRELGIRSTVIPINGRGGNAPPSGHYRAQMARRFHRHVYGQRWQIESAISRNKRLLGPALRARSEETQAAECLLRVLTHDLMILL